MMLSSRHRRHIGAAGGAGAHHAGDLRDARRRHLRLVEEDAAEVVAVGKNLVLLRQVGAAGIDHVDAGQPVLPRDLLGAQMLLHRHRVIGAALDGRVVGDDHAPRARDPADAGDHARARRLAVIEAVRRQLRRSPGTASRVEQRSTRSRAAACRIMQNARAINMPKDKVEAAIRRAAGRDAAHYQEVLYEGYAPHGVALLIETATDNPTRTVAHVRNIITRFGGNLATTGSVSFQFRKLGVFRLDPAGIDQDELELEMIDYGLDEMGEGLGEKGEPQLIVRCAFEDFGRLQEGLEARGTAPVSAEHEYLCLAATELPEPQANEALELIDKLEQEEDVQRVFHSLA
jgi:YebC/PmpR family DNA-binding regulatory protein